MRRFNIIISYCCFLRGTNVGVLLLLELTGSIKREKPHWVPSIHFRFEEYLKVFFFFLLIKLAFFSPNIYFCKFTFNKIEVKK